MMEQMLQGLQAIIDRLQTTHLHELSEAERILNSPMEYRHELAEQHAHCAYTYRQLIGDFAVIHSTLLAQWAQQLEHDAKLALEQFDHGSIHPSSLRPGEHLIVPPELKLINGGKDDQPPTH